MNLKENYNIYRKQIKHSNNYSFIWLFNIAIMNFLQFFCDLENNVKVKLQIWYKGLSKDTHLAFLKGWCGKNSLSYKHILLPLEYIEKVNFAL